MGDWLEVETTVPPAGEENLLEQVREWCRVDGSDDDDLLTRLAASAVRHIESETGLRLFTQTVVMRRGCFDYVMRLPTAPIQSISSFQYRDSAGDTQTLDGSTYEAVMLGGLTPQIYRAWGKSWPALYRSPQAITITAVAGYGALADLPEDIQHALQMLCEHWFDHRGADDAVPPIGVSRLIDPYRRPRIG